MSRPERRSFMVVLLDAVMKASIAAQSGPQPKVVPAGQRRSKARTWLAVGAALILAGTVAAVVALLRGPDDLSSLPPHTAARRTTAPATDAPAARSSSHPTVPPGAVASASGSAAPSGRPASSASGSVPGASASPPAQVRTSAPAPAPVPLSAQYTATDGGTGLLGYRAAVAITNPGAAGQKGWQLTLTLPRPTLSIARVSGATAHQDGSTWTFEPDDSTRSLPAGATVTVTFEVHGATLISAAPQDCQINNDPCGGLDDTAGNT